VTLTTYTNQSIEDALNTRIHADLDPTGASLIDGALEDYMDGLDPVLVFEVVNDHTEPAPGPADPLVFTWKVCVGLDIELHPPLQHPGK
jgi:hypothetical protein